MSSRVAAFDSLVDRVIAGPSTAAVVSSWNGLTGDVKGTLAEIFAFGLADAPLTDNRWTMPNGDRVFRSTPAGGSFTVVNDAFFEDPSIPADGRVAAWMTMRAQAPGQQSSTFDAATVYDARYAGPGTILDGTEWIADKGYLTASLDQAHQTGDALWSQIYLAANFFGEQPLSIPSAGLAGGQVAYLSDNLFARGQLSSPAVRLARRVSGWGQEFLYVQPQRNGITPAFVGVTHDTDIAVDAAGDGTAIWFVYGDSSHQDPDRVRGSYDAHMLTSDPNGNWGLGFWTRDGGLGPYQIAEMDQLVGLQLFRGGVQLPNVDTSTAPVGTAQAAKIVWDDALQKVRISVDGGAYVDLSVFS